MTFCFVCGKPERTSFAPGANRTAICRELSGHQGEACVGSISEIFDAEAPYTPRGCIAQAWSVAEVLRCWVNTMPQAVN